MSPSTFQDLVSSKKVIGGKQDFNSKGN